MGESLGVELVCEFHFRLRGVVRLRERRVLGFAGAAGREQRRLQLGALRIEHAQLQHRAQRGLPAQLRCVTLAPPLFVELCMGDLRTEFCGASIDK